MRLRRLIQLYRQLCGQGPECGVEGPVAVERAEELGMQLAEWERGSSDGAHEGGVLGGFLCGVQWS